ncbi:hypothetical protein J7K74_00945 [Candidatus Woesearchaeota archaeon]|nr:hypothetical protein [Candidatus Woesearchaeota archaeon]
MSRKSQAAIEYIVVIGIALALLLPAVYMFMRTTQRTSETTSSYQLARIANELVENAKAVYAMGSPSWITMEITLPDSFKNATVINGEELVFSFLSGGIISEIVVYTDIPLVTNRNISVDGDIYYLTDLHPGRNTVKLLVNNGKVYIENG